MKKALSIMLALTVILSLAACGKQGDASGSADTPASGSQSAASENQSQASSDQSYVAVKGTDSLPNVTADNEIYFDNMPHEDTEPVIEPVLEEAYAMSSATGKAAFCDGVEYEYKGSAELALGTLAQVDMVIGGEPVFSFFVNQGSVCYAAAENGGLLLVNNMPIQETQLIGEAEHILSQMQVDWSTDYEDTFEDEATGVKYSRIDEEGRTNPEELRAAYGETFSAKKADALLDETMKILVEKDGVYYAPRYGRSKKEGYAFAVYVPVEIGADKMTFKQIPYFYEQDEDGKATGLYQDESGISECVVIKEDGRWVIDQYTLPY